MSGKDLVSAAFHNMQQEAKKRGFKPRKAQTSRAASKAPNGFAPELSAPATKRRRGMPTGPDGRRLPKKDAMEAIGSVMQREINRRGWSNELAGGWVFHHWAELVGEQVAQHTKVEMMKNQALFISCDSTAWATNLRMMQRRILLAISRQVGEGLITELKIFGPKTPSWRYGPLHVKGRGPRDTYG